jgi:hypothetical protein
MSAAFTCSEHTRGRDVGMSGIVVLLGRRRSATTVLGFAQEDCIGAQGKLDQQGCKGAAVALAKHTPALFRDCHHHPAVRPPDCVSRLVMGQLLVNELGAVRRTQRGLDSGQARCRQ